MSHKTDTTNLLDFEVRAVELAGLAYAMHIVVTDYLSDPQPIKQNALDALSAALHAQANALAAHIVNAQGA